MTITYGELVADQAWSDRAVCSGHIQWFFAPPSERQRDRRAREYVARHICGQCPVLIECRDHARRHGEWGFWGGESEHERIAAGYPPTLSLQRGRNDHLVVSRVDGGPAAEPDASASDLSQAS